MGKSMNTVQTKKEPNNQNTQTLLCAGLLQKQDEQRSQTNTNTQKSFTSHEQVRSASALTVMDQAGSGDKSNKL